MIRSDAIVIRHASAADRAALDRLAQLDSREAPAMPALLAEVDGRAVAAIALGDGALVADPFTPTADIVALLRLRAARLRSVGASDTVGGRIAQLVRRPQRGTLTAGA